MPFINTWQAEGDAVNYALGALRTHVAHPPGSIGYCLVVGWLDALVGQVFISMLIISLIGAAFGIFFCHLLGKVIGLPWPLALLGAVVYGTSLNTFYSSLVTAPHILEGMFAALFATLGVLAIRRGSAMPALWAGIVLAIAGASRPSTTLFLLPAWIFMMIAVRPRPLGIIALHLILFGAIIAAWHIANDYYMAKAGYGGTTFDLQAMMPSPYEYASFSMTPPRFAHPQPTYHMPWFEIASWADRRSGLFLLPHKATWPEPSIKRALTLLALQICKFTFYFILAAPLFIIAWLGWLLGMLGRRREAWPRGKAAVFLCICLLSPVVLFVIGHMGAFDYLQLIMPVTSILAVYLLIGTEGAWTGPRKIIGGLALAAGIAGMLYFLIGRPLPPTSKLNRSVNTVLGAFSGNAIKYGVNIGNRATQLSASSVNPFDAVRTDAGFLRTVDETDFSPVPDMLRKTPPRHMNNQTPANPGS